MKKIASILAALVLCFGLAACGGLTIDGENVGYNNPAGAFTLYLPTSEEGDWTYAEDAADNVLDLTYKGEAANVQVIANSKAQTKYVAANLDAYQEYIMGNVLGDFGTGAELSETSLEPGEGISNIKAYDFTYNSSRGLLVFMESNLSYYTLMFTTAEESYGDVKAVFEDAVKTFEETQDGVYSDPNFEDE